MTGIKTMPNKVGRPKKQKVERVPFGAHRTKLQVPEIKGYKLRWINDVDGRPDEAIEGGYEFVLKDEVPRKIGQGNLHQDNSDINGRVSRVVSKGKTSPIRAFLMKIRKDWYEEDQSAKEQVNQQVDEALRQSTPGGNVVENQYVPKGHTQQV
jgi:hypothetical protein